MAQSKQALRSRIKSVQSTRKITKAMEMIANAKLFRQRARMEANREYSSRLQETVVELAAKNQGIDTVFLKKHKENPVVFSVVFFSDLGLCGSYNQYMLKLLKDKARKEDPLLVIGTSQYNVVRELGYNIINKEPIESDGLKIETIKGYIDNAIQDWLEEKIGGLQILYTRFVNTMTFTPASMTLLPCVDEQAIEEYANKVKEKQGEEKYRVETMFEPDASSILDTLIPMMIVDVAYSMWRESTTAEQGSRRVAMKTATDNADELSEDLLLEYNKARQASITQEITEIVGGSNAV